MGYACPVCSDPQADAGHLANHLAFSAILGGEDHETWLDEHASGWGRMGERELAEIVSKAVDETDFPRLFEDTVGSSESAEPPEERSGALFEEHGRPNAGSNRSGVDAGALDEETAAVLEEAKRMTRRMHEDADDDDG